MLISSILVELLAATLSSIIGVNRKSLRALFKKYGLLKEEEKTSRELSQKIERLTTSLQKSSELMAEIETGLEQQKLRAERWAEEEETSKLVASLNEKEVEAVRRVFGGQLEKENRKGARSALLWNIFFCIVGLVGGYLISKFLL